MALHGSNNEAKMRYHTIVLTDDLLTTALVESKQLRDWVSRAVPANSWSIIRSRGVCTLWRTKLSMLPRAKNYLARPQLSPMTKFSLQGNGEKKKH